MAISFKKTGLSLIVRIDGEIDANTAKSLRCEIDIEYDEVGARDIVFDFSKVSFMDSSGIGMIIGRYKKVQAVSGKIKMFAVDSNIKKIIDLSGLGQLVKIYRSEKEATGVR